MQIRPLALFAVVILSASSMLHAQTLKGSRTSMQRQYQEAVRYGYSFLQTPQSVKSFVSSGYLVSVTGDRMTELHDVSYPYARPEVKMFIQRLSGQYFSYCGEKLTVTSLTRPMNKQPANAAEDSVHPTGMAVDLRIPATRNCRSWLESTLLSLEATGVLDVTRERNPPHYHVAVYTKSYETYVANLGSETNEYVVMRGDTLSSIATRTGTSIVALRNSNALGNDLIRVGQKLNIPREASMEPMSSVFEPAVAQVLAAELPLVGPPAPDTVNLQASTVMAVDTGQLSTPEQYTVRRGDSLTSIANRTGSTIDELRSLNGLRNSNIIAGQTLLVPGSTAKGATFAEQPTLMLAVQAAQVGPQVPESLAASTRGLASINTTSPVQYTVRRGDSLSRIAGRMGTSIDELRRINGLRNSTIIAGQTLMIPVAADMAEMGSAPSDQMTRMLAVEHKVRRGESLWRIATRYGTSVSSLRRENGLSSDDLQPGQVLQVSLSLN